MATIKNIINELDNLFKIFNYKYFNSEVVKPVITVQTNGKDRNVLGWCTTKKMWHDTATKEEYFEISICAEYLYRDITEICSTLLHEICHLYNLQNDIKDVSRGTVYHNKRFKETAEKTGLIVEYDKKYGWAMTKPEPETIDFINSLNLDRNEFTLTRKTHHKIDLPPVGTGTDESGNESGNLTTDKPKQSTRKYICPICKTIIRATKDVNIICGDCNETMLKEEK